VAIFLLRRLLSLIPVIFGVCTITFFLIHLVPGDPVDLMLGDQASAIDKQVLKEQLGLHLPIWEQYTSFMSGAVQGDLGISLHTRQPVVTEIFTRLPATVELTLFSLILTVLIGIPLGIFAALRQNQFWDQASLVTGLLGMSIPNFWLGPVLILFFSIYLGWLPVSDRGGIEHLILPSLSLATALAAIIMRMTRSSMLEVIREDYIRTAKAKGLSTKDVYYKHALKNALMPIITILGLQLGALLTGAVITETIFDWPGVGTLLLQSIQTRDYPVVQGCVLFIACTYVFANTLADISYGLVNPKVRIQ
jgi:peptide/nickel transport system permease protein